MLGEQSAGLVQSGLHRALPATDRGCDLALAEVGVVPEDDDDSQMSRQILKGVDQILRGCNAARCILCQRERGEFATRGEALAMRDLLAQLRVTGVNDDPVKPGFDIRAARKRSAKSPSPQERLLNGLLGVAAIAEYQAGRAEGTCITLFEPGIQIVHISNDSRTVRKVRAERALPLPATACVPEGTRRSP